MYRSQDDDGRRGGRGPVAAPARRAAHQARALRSGLRRERQVLRGGYSIV